MRKRGMMKKQSVLLNWLILVLTIEFAFSANVLAANNELILSEEFVGNNFSSFNHSSSIAETHDGTLVVTWYGGSSEGADDVSIWVSTNDGNGWTPRIEVCDGGGDATWNPVLFQPASGPLLLYYKYGGSFSGGWEGSVRTSSDNGQTWSARIPLPVSTDPYLSAYNSRFVGPVKNKPLELPDGSLLCGSSTEHDGWQVHMEIAGGDYTSDYQLKRVSGNDAIQPTFLVHDDNYQTIQALCRARGSGEPTKVTWSYDGGSSWTSLSTISLETSKGIDAVTINNLNKERNRWHILAYNPSGRQPLRIATSSDGVNWNVAISDLDSGSDMDYPAIIQTSDKMLHLLYSYADHSKIKHVVIDPYVLLGEPVCVPADFSGNNVVDACDLSILSDGWLKSSSYVPVGTKPDSNYLVIHYNFDETSGSTAYDSSAPAYDGAVQVVSTGSPKTNAWDSGGQDAGCINFDGNTKVSVSSASTAFASVNSAVSVSLWINGNAAVQPDPGWGMPFHGGTPTNDRLLHTHIPTKDGDVMLESGSYNAQRLFWNGSSPSDWEGQWNHYTFTVDSTIENKVRIYHNGVKVAEGAASLGVGGIQSFSIGAGIFASGTAYEYFGKIDDFRIYNSALSADDILYIANDGVMLIGPDSPANLYDDDIIDGKDFAEFALYWLNRCD